MHMPKLAIRVALALMTLGVIVYFLSESKSVTALIPAFVGILMLICGIIGNAKESARMHAMHGALVVALIGVIGGAGKFFTSLGGAPLPLISSALLALLCAFFMVMGIRSFKAARLAREAAEGK